MDARYSHLARQSSLFTGASTPRQVGAPQGGQLLTSLGVRGGFGLPHTPAAGAHSYGFGQQQSQQQVGGYGLLSVQHTPGSGSQQQQTLSGSQSGGGGFDRGWCELLGAWFLVVSSPSAASAAWWPSRSQNVHEVRLILLVSQGRRRRFTAFAAVVCRPPPPLAGRRYRQQESVERAVQLGGARLWLHTPRECLCSRCPC